MTLRIAKTKDRLTELTVELNQLKKAYKKANSKASYHRTRCQAIPFAVSSSYFGGRDHAVRLQERMEQNHFALAWARAAKAVKRRERRILAFMLPVKSRKAKKLVPKPKKRTGFNSISKSLDEGVFINDEDPTIYISTLYKSTSKSKTKVHTYNSDNKRRKKPKSGGKRKKSLVSSRSEMLAKLHKLANNEE